MVANPDEEVGSPGSGELIAELASDQDYVLSCEPTAAKAVAKTEALLLGAAGTATVTMEVKGCGGRPNIDHGSRVSNDQGRKAAFGAAVCG